MALALLHCLSSSFVIPTPVLQPVILPNAIARAGSAPSMLSLPEGLALGAGAILLIASAGPLALLLAFGGAQMFRSNDDQEGVTPTLGIDTETYDALSLDTEEAAIKPRDASK